MRFALAMLASVSCLILVADARAQVLYVDDDAPFGGDGTSWQSAFQHLQDAMLVNTSGVDPVEIRIAQGIYHPDRDEGERITPGDRAASFRLHNRMVLRGGYRGIAGGGDPEDRDVDAFETILSGDLLDNDVSTSGLDDNSSHVCVGDNLGVGTRLDGLTVESGRANDLFDEFDGGGLLLHQSRLAIWHCTFRRNYAGNTGAAIASFDGQGLRVTSSVLIDNLAGLSTLHYSGTGVVRIEHSLIHNNDSLIGHAVDVRTDNLVINGCRFHSNTTKEFLSFPNAALNILGTSALVRNSVFLSNQCGFTIRSSAQTVVEGCTLVGNLKGQTSIRINGSALTIANMIHWFNWWPSFPAPIWLSNGATTDVTYSNFEEGAFNAGGISADPKFVGLIGSDGVPLSGDEDLRLSSGSPCIDAGNTLASRGPINLGSNGLALLLPIDLDGRPRYIDDRCTPDTGIPGPVPDFGYVSDMDVGALGATTLSHAVVDMGAFELADQFGLDTDSDGIANCTDNCPFDPNPTQHDCNDDLIGDVCSISRHFDLDCNSNQIPDSCDLAGGTITDCNTNGILDACDLAAATSPDCNANALPDECDIAQASSFDCNTTGVPDECETDCNINGIADECELDCNTNAIPDDCDLASATSEDCNNSGVPDECEIQTGEEDDCNGNTIPDSCDLALTSSADCNTNSVPDECEPDCNRNGVPDDCDTGAGTSLDCNTNSIPDECELDCNTNDNPDDCDLASATSDDCNNSGVPDECELQTGEAVDCNGNTIPDSCDLASNSSSDCNANTVPDECEPQFDCNSNGILDECDLFSGIDHDCNKNQIPDACDLAAATSVDCNNNAVPDTCDIMVGTSQDTQPFVHIGSPANGDGLPDECCLSRISPDLDGNGHVNLADYAHLMRCAGLNDGCVAGFARTQMGIDCNGVISPFNSCCNGCECGCADLNQDGFVDALDLESFVNSLSGP